MSRGISASLALGIIALASARAAEPPSPSQSPAKAGSSTDLPAEPSGVLPDLPARPVLAQRELTFAASSEPVLVDDRALEDQHFVAEVTFEIPPLRVCTQRQHGEPVEAVNPADRCGWVRLMSLAFRRSSIDSPIVKSSLARLPQERQPPGSLLDAFDTSRVVSRIGQVVNSYSTNPYEIYAPTFNRAKELTEALLRLYDAEVSYPVQLECHREIEQATKRLVAANKGLQESQAAIAAADKLLESLASYSDIDAGALATYRAQQRMLEVDLAGTMARIKACDRILRGGRKLPQAQAEQVETVKITAEIELQGLAARRSAISQIVDSGQQRVAALDRKTRQEELQPDWQFKITASRDQIAKYNVSLKEWAASPLKSNQVVIRPVEWKPPKKRRD